MTTEAKLLIDQIIELKLVTPINRDKIQKLQQELDKITQPDGI